MLSVVATLAGAAIAATLAVACGGGDENAGSGGVSGSSIATATATLESSDEKPTAAPTQEPGDISVANEPISVETPDGVVLQGHLYSPDGPKRQALIIVAAVEQSTWAESTEALTSEGVAVFTFDPRGFGETGGTQNATLLAADTRLITRFVMSREHPLVYLLGVGQDGASAAAEAAGNLDTLTGLVTYGHAGSSSAPYELPLAPDAAWAGEDVLADASVRDAVLTFVLGAN